MGSFLLSRKGLAALVDAKTLKKISLDKMFLAALFKIVKKIH